MISGRVTDGQRTLGRRSRSARIAAVISGDTEACRSCASASMGRLDGFLCCFGGLCLRSRVKSMCEHRCIGVVTPVDRLSREPPTVLAVGLRYARRVPDLLADGSMRPEARKRIESNDRRMLLSHWNPPLPLPDRADLARSAASEPRSLSRIASLVRRQADKGSP